MRPWTIRIVLAGMLVGCERTLGTQQAADPDFVLSIDVPAGVATIECTRGCALVGARDAANPNAGPMLRYSFGCSGAGQERCSAQVHGFLRR
jgi:hypothetical protein